MRDVNSGEKLHLHLKSDSASYDLQDIFPEYFVISIPAFHDEIHQNIDEWLYMMKHESIRDDFKAEYIKLAAERLNFLKMTLLEQANYMKYALEMVDVREEFETQHIKGKAEGKAEGKIEGRAECKAEMVKMLLHEGADLALIQRVSGLSTEYLAKLIDESA